MADDTRVTHSRLGLACAVALLCVIGCSMPAVAAAGDIIVRRDAGLTAAERAEIRADAGVKLTAMLPVGNAEVVSVPDGSEQAALKKLNRDPDVQAAFPDVPVHLATPPAPDPLFSLQLPLHSFNDADVDGPEAWTWSEGLGVTVAVADQHIDATHPDLEANIDPRPEIDSVESTDCTAGPPTLEDDHGTHVAWLIAAERDNGIGISGLAPLAKIFRLRAIDNCGGGSISSVIKAFDVAGERQIPIVSASFSTDPWLPAARKAEINDLLAGVLEKYEDTTLYVVAAGNEGNDNDALPVYPCNTLVDGADPDNLVCVGMTRNDDVPVCWGNVGRASVDLFAPGLSVLSTVSPATYTRMSGTSMATPLVAAAAALYKAQDQMTYGPAQIKSALIFSGVDELVGLTNYSVSGGRLNAARLVGDGRGLGSGGPDPPNGWTTCDRDHDGILDSSDACPDAPGPEGMQGCPDSDGDGVADAGDNCHLVANADQADTDGDRIGDACDGQPRGEDLDGDGFGALDDRCPTQFGVAPDGCPVVVQPPRRGDPTPAPIPTAIPTPEPVIVSLDVKFSKCRKGKKCAKVATVTVKLSRQARVAVKLERRDRNKRGRMVWKRIKSQSLTANARGGTVKVRGKRSGKKTKYRLTATLAGKAKAISFKV
jgi:hypothetical protein